MSLEFKISTAARNAACNAIVDLVDAGSGPGVLTFRSGTPPPNVADADSGTLLATLPMADPAFGNASVGVATAGNIASVTAVAGPLDVGHFRVKDSNANTIFQGTAGEAADVTDATFDEKTIVSGGTVAVTNGSFTVTVPIS